MPETPMWTERDIDIVRTLAVKVRVLTLDQVAMGWWESTKRATFHARRRLAKLVSANLLQRYRINVHPLLDATEPLYSWSPSSEAPDAAALSERAQSRWTEPATPTNVYTASPLAANLFASYARRLLRPSEWDHDLLLAQVYVHYVKTDPNLARHWSGEDTRVKAGHRIKDPDVFVYDDDDRICLVVESAGRYTVTQIAAFHEHCVKYDLPYELW